MRHSSSAAGHRPKRKMTRAASAAACVPTWAPIEALVGRADRRHPARILRGGVLGRLVHRVGIAGRDELERVERVDLRAPRPRRRRRRDAARRGWPAPCRCRCPSRRDRNRSRSGRRASISTRAERAVRAGAVILGDAGDAGADQHARPARAPSPARARARSDASRACRGFPACGPRRCRDCRSWSGRPACSALRRRNSIGSSGNAAAASSISTSSAVIVCSVP